MSKCTAVSKFAQPGQRHKWGAIRRLGPEIFRYCLACGEEQFDKQIPASVRRQFELESSVRARTKRRGVAR